MMGADRWVVVMMMVLLWFGVAGLDAAAQVSDLQKSDAARIHDYLAVFSVVGSAWPEFPVPVGGVRLPVDATVVNGTWVSDGGAEGPVLVIDNFGTGMMGVALLLPPEALGRQTWIYSVGPFGLTSVLGGTFYLGDLQLMALSGRATIGLSWVSERELLLTYYATDGWAGPVPVVSMRRLAG